jgi:hypothetical protein
MPLGDRATETDNPRPAAPPPSSAGQPDTQDECYGYAPTASSARRGRAPPCPADGITASADGGTTPATHDGWMWDLTVLGEGDHDFYVAVGDGEDAAALLVHVAARVPERETMFVGAPAAQGRAGWRREPSLHAVRRSSVDNRRQRFLSKMNGLKFTHFDR